MHSLGVPFEFPPTATAAMPTVTIIGAGVAGLQACRALSKWGFDVLVLEQSSSVGGVWSRNYQVGLVPWMEQGQLRHPTCWCTIAHCTLACVSNCTQHTLQHRMYRNDHDHTCNILTVLHLPCAAGLWHPR